jgi:hypothetical protein
MVPYGKCISSEALIFGCFYFTEANILLESLYCGYCFAGFKPRKSFSDKILQNQPAETRFVV